MSTFRHFPSLSCFPGSIRRKKSYLLRQLLLCGVVAWWCGNREYRRLRTPSEGEGKRGKHGASARLSAARNTFVNFRQSKRCTCMKASRRVRVRVLGLSNNDHPYLQRNAVATLAFLRAGILSQRHNQPDHMGPADRAGGPEGGPAAAVEALRYVFLRRERLTRPVTAPHAGGCLSGKGAAVL